MEGRKDSPRASLADLAQEAINSRDKGELDRARQLFTAIVSRNPENAPAHYELAKLLQLANEPEGALTHISQAVGSAKSNIDYVLFQASLFFRLKKPHESLQCLQRFLDIYPEHLVALTVYAYYLLICGQPKDAEIICRKQ